MGHSAPPDGLQQIAIAVAVTVRSDGMDARTLDPARVIAARVAALVARARHR
jgi:hypothetical protein